MRREPGDEPVRVVHELGADLVPEDDLLVGHEQDEQHGGVAREREPGPLARGVHHDVEVAGARPVGEAAGFVPHGVPLVLLERDARLLPPDPVGHPRQARHERGRLQADPHLVPVVLPADRGAVNAGPDLGPQDQPLLGEPTSLLGGVRVREPGRKETAIGSLDHAGHRTGA